MQDVYSDGFLSFMTMLPAQRATTISTMTNKPLMS